MTRKDKLDNKLNQKLLLRGFSVNELQFCGIWNIGLDTKEMQKLIYKSKNFNKLENELCEHLEYISCISAIQRY